MWDTIGISVSEREQPKALRFTVPRDEVRQAVGITPKQLRSWQEAGIFTPELGKGSQRFTEYDVERLKFLKLLILDLGLPVSTAQQLLTPFVEPVISLAERSRKIRQGLRYFPRKPLNSPFFLLLNEKRLLQYDQAFDVLRDWIRDANLTEDGKDLVETWLLALVGIRVRYFNKKSSSTYQSELDALVEKIRRADMAARVEVHDNPNVEERCEWVLAPRLRDDPDPPQEELGRLHKDHITRVGEPLPPY